MNSMDKALQTQLQNIQTRTGKTLEQLYEIIRKSGLSKHGEIREMLKNELGMGHGDANTLVHFYTRSAGEGAAQAGGTSIEEAVNEIYAGSKAALRPIHEKLMAEITKFGPFEVAPKKGYLSLRRKKQFAMIGPATKTRVEVGLNMKGVAATTRLIEMPPGKMCQYKVNLSDSREVDKELISWIKQAYDSAG